MSSVTVTIQELFESGQSLSKILDLLKRRTSRSGVYKVHKRLKETGPDLPKVRSTLSRKVRTPKLIKNTRENIRRNLRKSVPKLASASGVTYGTMQTVLKNDLNLAPYKITKSQLLSQATKTKRLQRAKFLLENPRYGTQPPFLWTDKKLFTVQAVHHPQNNRIYAVNKSDIPLNNRLTFWKQKPASVMVWAGANFHRREDSPHLYWRGD